MGFGGWAIRLVSAIALCVSSSAWAADGANPSAEAASGDFASSLSAYLHAITGWNGERSKFEQAGLTFTFTYYGDAFVNPVGGLKQGAGYDGRFGTIVDADLEKLVGWSGAAFHASIHQIHGTEFSAENLDNLMTVSGIEAPPTTRLFNLWVAQKFGSKIDVRLGQFTAAQEFETSDGANLFINSTFGWPVLNAQDLPSGGPAYPEATPGARVQFTANDNLTLRAAVFNGDPAGPGTGNPVSRDPFGLAFRVSDPPLFIAEMVYSYGQQGTGSGGGNLNQEGELLRPRRAMARAAEQDLPGTIKFGAWVHTGSFADQFFDAQGAPLPVGMPMQHAGDFALYGIIDQMLWRVPGDTERALSLFFRGSIAPSDRNLIDLYVDGGLTFKGPLASRRDDTIGIAAAFARISPLASASDRETIAFTGIAMPVRDFEAAIELTYQWSLGNNWFVQPDLQYVIHPGGNIANPLGLAPASPIPNALVLGVRTTGRF